MGGEILEGKRMGVTGDGNEKQGLHPLFIKYATDAAAKVDEIMDLLRLAKDAYEKSANAGKSRRWSEMNRLRGEGTEYLNQAEKVWQNDNNEG